MSSRAPTVTELVQHTRRALAEHRTPSRCITTPLIGASEPMQALAATVARVAPASSPVLLQGETGTGKELVGRAIHAASARRDQPFVTMNCAAIPEALAESELFGHARGAFTGAVADRLGVFREADGGTLLLDEIGDMPLALQAKLLRTLQQREVRPVGASTTHPVDVRVIAATHQDLEQRVAQGEFRADLYFRLAVLPVAIPPLRDRAGDIALLAAHFVDRAHAANPASPVTTIADDAHRVLEAYAWPGNVRELENVVERLVVLGAGPAITAADLRLIAPQLFAASTRAFAPDGFVSLRQLESDYIAWVVERTGSRARAAEVLGIDPSTLYRRERRRRI